MGQSTNAIIAYGFDLGEELPESIQTAKKEDEDFEWEKFLAADYGIDLPEYGMHTTYKQFAVAREIALEQIPVDIIEHCSGEYPMYFLAARGTDSTATRGNPHAIELPPIPQSAILAMRAFCERHDIEWHEPKWHIFSMWN